jgi:hypothetical protein
LKGRNLSGELNSTAAAPLKGGVILADSFDPRRH